MNIHTQVLFDSIYIRLQETIFSENEDVLLETLRKEGYESYLRDDWRFKQTPNGYWINRNTHLLNDDLFQILQNPTGSLKTLQLKKCPHCSYIGTIEKMFGYRKRNSSTGTLKLDEQSFCVQCRGKNKREPCKQPTIDLQSFPPSVFSFCSRDERFTLLPKVFSVQLKEQKSSLPKGTLKEVHGMFQYSTYIPVLATESVLRQNIQLNKGEKVHDSYPPLGWFPVPDIDLTFEELQHSFVGQYNGKWAVFMFNANVYDGYWLCLDGDRVSTRPGSSGLAIWIQDLAKSVRKRTPKNIKKRLEDRWRKFYGDSQSDGFQKSHQADKPLLSPVCFVDTTGDSNKTVFGFELATTQMSDIAGLGTWIQHNFIARWGIDIQDEQSWALPTAYEGLFDDQYIKCTPNADTPTIIFKAMNPQQQQALDASIPSLLKNIYVVEKLLPQTINCFKMDDLGVARLQATKGLLLNQRYCMVIPPDIPLANTIPNFVYERYANGWLKIDGVVSTDNQKSFMDMGFSIQNSPPKIDVFERLAGQYETINGQRVPIFQKGYGCLRCSGLTVDEENKASLVLIDASNEQTCIALGPGTEWKIDLSSLESGKYLVSIVTENTDTALFHFAFMIQDEIEIKPQLSTITLRNNKHEFEAIDFYDCEVIRAQLSDFLSDERSLEEEGALIQGYICGPPFWPITIDIYDIAKSNYESTGRKYQFDETGTFYIDVLRNKFKEYFDSDVRVNFSAPQSGYVGLRHYPDLTFPGKEKWEKKISRLVAQKSQSQTVEEICTDFLHPLFHGLGYTRVSFEDQLIINQEFVGDVYRLYGTQYTEFMMSQLHLDTIGWGIIVPEVKPLSIDSVVQWIRKNPEISQMVPTYVFVIDDANICRINSQELDIPVDMRMIFALQDRRIFNFVRTANRRVKSNA